MKSSTSKRVIAPNRTAWMMCLLAVLVVGAVTDRQAVGSPQASPNIGGVVTAFVTARGWLNEFQMPDPSEETARIPIEGASGVCIILRQNGRLVGMGQDESGDALMVRRALGRAMGETLADPSVQAMAEGDQKLIGRRLTMQLEVAGVQTPALGSTYRQIAERLQAGIDGVALRRGSRWRMEFPSRSMAMNTSSSFEAAFPRLATDLGLPAKELADLERIDRVGAYRFRTLCLTQATPEHSPFEVVRNDETVEQSAVTRASIISMTQRLVDHVLTRLPVWTEEETKTLPPPVGMRGDYRPISDQYRPMVASPFDQALTAYVLGRVSACDAVVPETAAKATVAARRIVEELSLVSSGEDDPFEDPAAAAALVLAFRALPDIGKGPLENFLSQARGVVKASFDPVEGFRVPSAHEAESEDAEKPAATLTPARQAIVSAALAAMYQDGRRVDESTVRAAVESAWKSVEADRTTELLPWIVNAEVLLSRGAAIEGSERLQMVRESIERSQVAAQHADRGLAGGFVLSRRGANATPTSQSTRPGAGLAAMYADSRLTTSETKAGHGRVLLNYARFVMQLSVRESSTWSYRRPDRALGGIRENLTDSDQALAAQAMAPLSLIDLLDGMRE